MAEESFQEKTEQATPRKREEARRKGQVARSTELSSVTIMLAGLIALMLLGPIMYGELSRLVIDLLTDAASIELDSMALRAYINRWGMGYALVVAPLVTVLVAAGLAVNYAQVGVLFSGESLTPKAERISPLSGLKRMFSSRGLMELAKGLFKVGVAMWVTYVTIAAEVGGMVRYIGMEVPQIFAISKELIFTLSFRILLLLLVMAVLDYAYQRWESEKNLRMTRQEVREETKQQEGDPQLKARVRSLQRDMARRRMMGEVGEADVVVTNPTHIAVALRYEPGTMDAPVVVAKGQRLMAQKIKDVARSSGVPLVENKPLARALFKAVQIGDSVPEDLFRAVAEVLAFVFQLKGRR